MMGFLDVSLLKHGYFGYLCEISGGYGKPSKKKTPMVIMPLPPQKSSHKNGKIVVSHRKKKHKTYKNKKSILMPLRKDCFGESGNSAGDLFGMVKT